MSNFIVSIIVPIYNVQDYVLPCLRSIACQTYLGNIECLLIDDCGNDNSIIHAENFLLGYKGNINFRIIHHNFNKGLSASRNTGIKESTGELLFFLDGDDTISPNCIEELVNVFRFHDVDMTIGNVSVIDRCMKWDLLRLPSGIYTENLIEKYIACDYYIPVWNKLIKKDFILNNNLFFEDGLIHEDYLWSFKCACHLKKIAIVDTVTYHYLRREGSLDSQRNLALHINNYSKACMLQAQYLKQQGDLWYNTLMYRYVDHKRYNYMIKAYKLRDKALLLQCYDYYRRAPEWNIIRKIKTHFSIGEIVISFHRILPSKLGFLLCSFFLKQHLSS